MEFLEPPLVGDFSLAIKFLRQLEASFRGKWNFHEENVVYVGYV